MLFDFTSRTSRRTLLNAKPLVCSSEHFIEPRDAAQGIEIWIDRRYVPAGYGWSFPARDELRVGVGSFDPRFHIRETTELLASDLGRDRVRYQGNWIPHKLRTATEGMLPPRQVARIIALIDRLEDVTDVRELATALRASP